jgi:hypothetical protein
MLLLLQMLIQQNKILNIISSRCVIYRLHNGFFYLSKSVSTAYHIRPFLNHL